MRATRLLSTNPKNGFRGELRHFEFINAFWPIIRHIPLLPVFTHVRRVFFERASLLGLKGVSSN